MKKIILVLILSVFAIGCPRSRVHTKWEDSNLSKKEYLRRKLERAQDNKEYEEGLIKPLKKIISPEW